MSKDFKDTDKIVTIHYRPHLILNSTINKDMLPIGTFRYFDIDGRLLFWSSLYDTDFILSDRAISLGIKQQYIQVQRQIGKNNIIYSLRPNLVMVGDIPNKRLIINNLV